MGVDHQEDADTERNEGKKLWQLQSDFSIPATSKIEIGGGSFAWSLRACLWFHLAESSTDGRESIKRSSCSSGGFWCFLAIPETVSFE